MRASIASVVESICWYPTEGGFLLYGGPGFASGKIQGIPGTGNRECSDDDFRTRWYELEGFGPDGGKQSQLNSEAAVAPGWRF